MREEIESMIRLAWPHVIDIHEMTHVSQGHCHQVNYIKIDRDGVRWNEHYGYFDLVLPWSSGAAQGVWEGQVTCRSGHTYPPIADTWDRAALQTAPEAFEQFDELVRERYGRDCRVLHYRCPHGLPPTGKFFLMAVNGIGYEEPWHYSKVFTAPNIEHPFELIVQHQRPRLDGSEPLTTVPAPIVNPGNEYLTAVNMQNIGAGPGCACGDPFCGGCATGHARSQGQNSGGGAVLTPAQSFTMTPSMSVTISATTPKLSAYDVLKEIEGHLDCKTGMLNSTNILIFRITIPDEKRSGQKWQAALAERMDELKSKLGDKIGILGDMKIVGLDEPYQPDGGPSYVHTESATGKVAVHLARRETYQATKVTILALVKA